jgi:hypothetical protein
VKYHFPTNASKLTIEMDTVETISSQFRSFHKIETIYQKYRGVICPQKPLIQVGKASKNYKAFMGSFLT